MAGDRAMKVFVVYKEDRVTLEVALHQTVAELREIVRDIFQIGPDEGPTSSEEQETLRLTLTYAGADLNPKWFIADVGIVSGVTLRAVLREEVKASLLIHVTFTGEVKEISEKIHFSTTPVSDIRSLASRVSGLPVGCFRLLSPAGAEMYDIHVLEVYNIVLGDKIKLEVWDGWTDFLKAAMAGQVSTVTSLLSPDEVTARYQCKVALYIASNCGHSDLALTMIKVGGVRADEPVGYHPTRQWCKSVVKHIDSLKTPIHEAARSDQVGVLRSFVHLDIGNVLARDGHGLTPLNVALRSRSQKCSQLLLTKQWSKVPYAKKASLPLSLYVKMKKWCERSRERTFVIHGQWKSSLKRKFIQEGLVGYGVQLDGFSKSALNSQPISDEARRKRSLRAGTASSNGEEASITPEAYFRLVMQSHNTGLPRMTRIMMNIAQTDAGDHDEDAPANTDNSEDAAAADGQNPSRAKGKKKASQLPPIINSGALVPAKSRSPQSLQFKKKDSESQETGRGGGGGGGAIVPSPPAKPAPRSRLSIAVDNSVKQRARAQDAQAALAFNKFRRPYVYLPDGDIMSVTMDEFTLRHGLSSRDYALRCLAVAQRFKDKSWMSQVMQALVIARRGVNKTMSGQPHLFADDIPVKV